jgi:hypothetical protein
MKVKLRFITNSGKQCTSERMLKGILPALWDENDRQDVITTVGDFVSLLNDNKVFFYPFPLDLYRTGLLDKYVGGYQHFPWDMLDEDIHPLCEVCRDWDFSKTLAPVKPFLMQGQAHAFLCPNCHNIVVDDYAAGKAGASFWLTKKQFRERFGRDAPEVFQE